LGRQELLCLPAGLVRGEERSGDGCDEFDDGLVGDANAVLGDPPPQDLRRDSLLLRKSRVETVDEDVRIKKSRHDGRVRRESNLVPPGRVACV